MRKCAFRFQCIIQTDDSSEQMQITNIFISFNDQIIWFDPNWNETAILYLFWSIETGFFYSFRPIESICNSDSPKFTQMPLFHILWEVLKVWLGGTWVYNIGVTSFMKSPWTVSRNPDSLAYTRLVLHVHRILALCLKKVSGTFQSFGCPF